jgi:tripartite-type tricarboxylate transporter receptor subunit TctC
VLVTRPDFPATSLLELVRAIKERAGKASYGSGNASSRLVTELFRLTIGADLVYVPYKGNAQALSDVAAGHIDLMFADTVSSQSFLKADKVKAFLVTSDQRLKVVPDIPTALEMQLPELSVSAWAALVAPANTPPDVIEKLNRAVGIAMKSETAVKLFETTNLVPAFGSPDDLSTFVKSEISKWGRVVDAAHIAKD